MSANKNLMLMAELLENFYVLPYSHDELLDLLSRIKDGYFLTKNEYEALKGIIVGDDGEDNSDIELFFSGDYKDLKNKPYIPKKLSDMSDYKTFTTAINNSWALLKDRDAQLEEQINTSSRMLSTLETILSKNIERLENTVNAIKVFEGEELEEVILNVKDDLAQLKQVSIDLSNGRTLSEKDFTAEYEEILRTITNTTNGLAGYIRDVIAESIVDKGNPNGNGNFRLDSIGEALATKVDKDTERDLSHNDFTDEYKDVIDDIFEAYKSYTYDPNVDGEIPLTPLMYYISMIVDRYEQAFDDMINRTNEMLVQNTKDEIEKISKDIADKFKEHDDLLENMQDVTALGTVFEKNDGATSITLGGLQKGTVLEGKTVREVLLEILCPFVGPTVSGGLRLSASSSGYLTKIGTSVIITHITAYINKGTLPILKTEFKKFNGYDYDSLAVYSGEMNQHSIGVFEITKSIPSDYFIVEVTDSKGNVYTSNTQAIDIVYPIYFGSVDKDIVFDENGIKNLHENVLYPGSECRIKYTTNNERMVIAVPRSHGTVSEIIDPNGYNITKSFSRVELTMKFKVTEQYGDIIKTNEYTQDYIVYYNNPSTVTTFELTFRF